MWPVLSWQIMVYQDVPHLKSGHQLDIRWSTPDKSLFGAFQSHGGSPVHPPFLDGMSPYEASSWVPPWPWKPPSGSRIQFFRLHSVGPAAEALPNYAGGRIGDAPCSASSSVESWRGWRQTVQGKCWEMNIEYIWYVVIHITYIYDVYLCM